MEKTVMRRARARCRKYREFDERIFFTNRSVPFYNKTHQKSSGIQIRRFRRKIPFLFIVMIADRKECGWCYCRQDIVADDCRSCCFNGPV